MGIIITMHKVHTIAIREEKKTMDVNKGNLKIMNLVKKRNSIQTNMDIKLIH